jgi:hypothetical protein
MFQTQEQLNNNINHIKFLMINLDIKNNDEKHKLADFINETYIEPLHDKSRGIMPKDVKDKYNENVLPYEKLFCQVINSLK